MPELMVNVDRQRRASKGRSRGAILLQGEEVGSVGGEAAEMNEEGLHLSCSWTFLGGNCGTLEDRKVSQALELDPLNSPFCQKEDFGHSASCKTGGFPGEGVEERGCLGLWSWAWIWFCRAVGAPGVQ